MCTKELLRIISLFIENLLCVVYSTYTISHSEDHFTGMQSLGELETEKGIPPGRRRQM